MNSSLLEIAEKFELRAAPTRLVPVTTGHINETFRLETTLASQPDYLLQRINHAIFTDVPALQQNIVRVTEHIRGKLQQAGIADWSRRVLTLVPARDGQWFTRDGDGAYWRLMEFIPGSHSYDQLGSADLALKAGTAFGGFCAMLADLPGAPLHETIRDFHNMRYRLQQYRDAVMTDPVQRTAAVAKEMQAIEQRADDMLTIDRLRADGQLPLRTVHCDTKINNVLFDEHDDILCVIDLDTVMSGCVTSDFGDAIRTGANTGAEDDPDPARVGLSLSLYEGYAQGFLQATRSFITPAETGCLALSAKMFAYMQAVRFLTDYLNGDTYYRIAHPEHNLQRTRAQLALLFSMEAQWDAMQRIVDTAARRQA